MHDAVVQLVPGFVAVLHTVPDLCQQCKDCRRHWLCGVLPNTRVHFTYTNEILLDHALCVTVMECDSQYVALKDGMMANADNTTRLDILTSEL